MVTENDLEDMLAHTLKEVTEAFGKVNLAEIERRTGISRQRLRKWQKDGYKILPNEKKGRPKKEGKLENYKTELNALLSNGIANSEVCLARIRELGYDGGITLVKDYIHQNKHLVPAKRQAIDTNGNRGRRYYTESGDCFQMDWGFVDVVDVLGNRWRAACFAMVCHHCGSRYIEFFPNAKQENLFIGMIHAFMQMGVPKRVLTDNMKSVRDRTDSTGKPIFNKLYDEFQHVVGFRTELCKVAHPFTKGKVERLVRYVKDNFIRGRVFFNVTDLNEKALAWCREKNQNPIKGYDFIPALEHNYNEIFNKLPSAKELLPFLDPLRKVGFDGYINYEGRLFGVPYCYKNREVRVHRHEEQLLIIDSMTGIPIQTHVVDWSKRAKPAPHQWDDQPEELPTAPIKVTMTMRAITSKEQRFSRFAFEDKEVTR